METSTIVSVLLSSIDNNPFRLVDKYPFVEEKLDALQRSIAAVGFWEGVIGRRAGNRIQIAFGHHRVEAAGRSGLKSVPIIVRDLSDEIMLQLMGRENDEDYNSDFLCMLETWESAVKWSIENNKSTKRLDVSRLLGWTRVNPRTEAGDRPSVAADACDLAHYAIEANLFERTTFTGMSVSTVSNLVQTHQGEQERLDKTAHAFGWTEKEKKEKKAALTDAVKKTAKAVRAGHVGTNYQSVKASITGEFMSIPAIRKDPQLLNRHLDDLRKRVDRVLVNDAVDKRMHDFLKHLPEIASDLDRYDVNGIKALAIAFTSLSQRSRTNSRALDLDKIEHVKPKEMTKLELKKLPAR